jgi:uncharacterized damage-inducible protein DinB
MYIKLPGFFLLLLLTGTQAKETKAQTTDSLLSQLSVKWNNARMYALKIAEMMPEEFYDFKPVPEQMSFGKQVLHTAGNMNWLSSAYLFASKQNLKTDTAHLRKADIIRLLGLAYDSALVVHYRLKEKQLDEVVSFFAGPKTRRQILILMHDHQTHHIGQLIVYLRLKGIKPPDYVGW